MDRPPLQFLAGAEILRDDDSTWNETLLRSDSERLRAIVAESERKRYQESERFGAAQHLPLKNYLDLPEIAAIINSLWADIFSGHFKRVGMEKKARNAFVDVIISIRNPRVHGRENASSHADVEIASSYCNKLGEMCNAYFREIA